MAGNFFDGQFFGSGFFGVVVDATTVAPTPAMRKKRKGRIEHPAEAMRRLRIDETIIIEPISPLEDDEDDILILAWSRVLH